MTLTARANARSPSGTHWSDVRPTRQALDLVWSELGSGFDSAEQVVVMLQGATADPARLGCMMQAAADSNGRYAAPVVVLGGVLRLPFDELETLRATAGCVALLAAREPKLREPLAEIERRLASPLCTRYPAGVLVDLAQHLRALFSQSGKAQWVDYLDDSIRRTLLAARCFQRRALFGGMYVRALFADAAGGIVPAYLPEAAQARLPCIASLRVRLLGELHPSVDDAETAQLALRVMALGRQVFAC
jgi:hypothetical protein